MAMHAALRSTRGASLAVADLHYQRAELRYVGIGNISAVIAEGTNTRSLVSTNGTVGHEMHAVREFVYPWSERCALLMHSDGLQTRWHLGDYPGLAVRHPSIIAAVLFRDFHRGRDDATVLVTRAGSA